MAAAPHARKARASNRTEGTSMIADVRLFRHGASVGSRVAPHVWAFVLAGSASRRGPATLKRALDRATRLAPAHRVVAIMSRDSARACAGVLAETPDIATIVQPAYRGSAAELFLPALLVARRDPDAVVLALRADETHDGPVAPCLARAIRAVDLRPDLTVLVGARPRTTRAPDGFVEPGSPLEGCEELSLLAVRRFVYEAPRGLCARGLLAPAALAARARALRALVAARRRSRRVDGRRGGAARGGARPLDRRLCHHRRGHRGHARADARAPRGGALRRRAACGPRRASYHALVPRRRAGAGRAARDPGRRGARRAGGAAC